MGCGDSNRFIHSKLVLAPKSRVRINTLDANHATSQDTFYSYLALVAISFPQIGHS